ncbi:hypothetical protein BN13_960007 [Nostocoides jenkinsii Ben 74]|uniref:Uncharacterized protein n=1 Tax=Nostocoides jenkinsii Ben 74 TaxID=1193518 RepID=A0A077MGR0_9MICO|nr:hypothetical protein BN13_960007 [Tetrasphaera jenkinsii Ben 74]
MGAPGLNGALAKPRRGGECQVPASAALGLPMVRLGSVRAADRH